MEDRLSAGVSLRTRLFQLTRPYWLRIAGVTAVSLLSTPLALFSPYPLKIVVDSVIGSEPLPSWTRSAFGSVSGPETALLVAVAMLFGIALLNEIQSLVSWMLQAHISEHLLLSFRAQLFRHAQRLSMTYHDLRGSTDSTYRIQYDAQSIQNLAINGVVPFVTALVTLTVMTLVMVRMDWRVACVAVAMIPVIFALARHSSAELFEQWEEIRRSDSRSMAILQEVLGALRVVKAFGQEDRERDRFVTHSKKVTSGHVKLARTQGSFHLAIGMTMATASAVALYLGTSHVRAGLLSTGDLVVLMSYMAQVFAPVQAMAKRFGQIQGAVAGVQRAFALLDEVPEVRERPHARRISRTTGSMAVEHVSFSYEAHRAVLHDVTFTVAPGARVGIAGRTGAGKTTLINLLTRMYDPTRGSIKLDGVDLRDYALDDLRRQFGIVLQEPVLFSTTIRENIAYARPEASLEEIVAAARSANVHDFIGALPQGYDTVVGERGFRLSGGERQRVSLARAFLKDAPILVLDEPTSSVDVGTETQIIDAMARLMRGRTTFMIAHRLSTLDSCDVRLVLEEGRLRQSSPERVGAH